MVIKDLLNSIKETILLLKELERSAAHNSSEIEFLRHKLTALKEIQRYVTGGDWTRDASREKFVALAKSDFEYKLIASRYHTTRASLDVFVSRQNERLERVIGEALTLIAENRIEEGLSSFYANAGLLSSKEFEYQIKEILPEGANKDGLLVDDCAREVKMLRSLLKSNLKAWLNGADYDKLAHLMFLLDTDDKVYQQQKQKLISMLRQKDSSNALEVKITT